MSTTTPTKRSLDKLRKEGFSVAVIEKWIPATPAGYKGHIIRRDVWGFADLLAVKVGVPGALLVQCTTNTGGQFSKHLAKIRQCAEAGIWLAAGNSIRLMTWAKQGAAGTRKKYLCREMNITAETLLNITNTEMNRSGTLPPIAEADESPEGPGRDGNKPLMKNRVSNDGSSPTGKLAATLSKAPGEWFASMRAAVDQAQVESQ